MYLSTHPPCGFGWIDGNVTSRNQSLFTIYMRKPVGRRFVQMVSENPQWKISIRIGVYHLHNPY